jgi:signal transduction histidine kinase/CheY-like chemotaxis protein
MNSAVVGPVPTTSKAKAVCVHAYGTLLEGLLDLMESEYGLISQVSRKQDGTMYLQTQAHTKKSRAKLALGGDLTHIQEFGGDTDAGLGFPSMDALLDAIMTSGEPIISNNPEGSGHPALKSFLGIPFFNQDGERELIGIIAIANTSTPGGYVESDVCYLEPVTAACRNLLQTCANATQVVPEQNKHAVVVNNSNDNSNLLLENNMANERTRELQQVNHNLEEANKRGLEASALQMRHFACMSHEIRTPLNCIIGLSSLLQETKLDAMQAESLNMIVSSGDLLLTVVNDVLDYSKLKSGNVDIEIRKSNLQETLNSCVHSIETRALDKQLSVRTFYDVLLPEFVTTDSRRLQQIMYNLLGNSIKFSKEGGVIELHVSLCDDLSVVMEEEEDHMPQSSEAYPRTDTSSTLPTQASSLSQSAHNDTKALNDAMNEIEIQCSEDNVKQRKQQQQQQVIRFLVKDYGTGIAKKDCDRIFEPFQQASAETERVYGGTGLGLAITAKLVHGLGGTIAVDSEEGEWSEFTVDLPFNEKPANINEISSRLGEATVLLVHKDTESLVQVQDSLRRYNVDFHDFNNLNEMEARIVEQGFLISGRSYICLVDEELYSRPSIELLSNLATKSMLLTFGPNYCVKESAGHYRSLVQVIPSVLLQSLGGYCESLIVGRGLTRSLSNSSMHSIPYTGLKVLIAEDNVINQKVLHRMLKRLGIADVDIVDNGQKAVLQEASREYDVVLMDMQMPVMDGVEACKLICSREGGHPNASVIFVTAHASSSYELECAKAGGVDYLSKPFNLRDIEKCLERLYCM